MISLKKDLFGFSLVFLSYIFSFPALSNLGGTDIQNFNPTSSGLDFVTVHSARTLSPYELNFGGFFNYVTNSLSYSTLSHTSNSQKFGDPNDVLLYSNFHFGFGILSNWDVGVSIGSVIDQQINRESNFAFFYDVKGLNDIRLNSKIRFLEKGNSRLAVVGSVDFERIKENPFGGNGQGSTFNLEAVGDFRLKPDLLWAVNFGYRLRQEGSAISNSGIIPISDQLIYSSAVSYKTDDKNSAVIGEIYGGFPTEQNEISTDRKLSNLEILAGYRFSGIKNFDLHGGFGTRIYNGLGSPDLRIYLGLNWRMDQIARAVGLQEKKVQHVVPPQEKNMGNKPVTKELESAKEMKGIEEELQRDIQQPSEEIPYPQRPEIDDFSEEY